MRLEDSSQDEGTVTSPRSPSGNTELTKAIYEAMQIPYLSERHDAIQSLIDQTATNRCLEEHEWFQKVIAEEAIHNMPWLKVVDTTKLDKRLATLKAQLDKEKS